jgi:hypothetical protein
MRAVIVAVMVELCPHKIYIDVLYPVFVDMTLFGNRVFAAVIKLRLYLIKVGPERSVTDGCPSSNMRIWTQTLRKEDHTKTRQKLKSAS